MLKKLQLSDISHLEDSSFKASDLANLSKVNPLKKSFKEFDLSDNSNPAVQALLKFITEVVIRKDKNLSGWEIPNLDLSQVSEEDFYGVRLGQIDGVINSEPVMLAAGADISGTDALIIPTELDGKSLEGVNCAGLDFTHLFENDWKGVKISSANFSNVTGLKNIKITDLATTRKDKVEKPDLSGVNFTNVDLSDIPFSDWKKVYHEGADFSNTNARTTFVQEATHQLNGFLSKGSSQKEMHSVRNPEPENPPRSNNFGISGNPSQEGQKNNIRPSRTKINVQGKDGVDR